MVRAHKLIEYTRQSKGSPFVISFYRGEKTWALRRCLCLSCHVANPPPPLSSTSTREVSLWAHCLQRPFISAELAISLPLFSPLLSSQVTASHPTTREVTARAIQLHHLHLHHHLPTTTGATAPTPRPHIPRRHPPLHRPTLSPAITSISR